MEHKTIYLDPADQRVTLDTYVADDRSRVRDALIVIPGGGYRDVCKSREGEPVALEFFSRGMNCFVLNYRVSMETDRYPTQLIDVSRAILYVKRNAEALGINPDRVFVLGFSAGGHLAASSAVLHKDPEVLKALGISKGENKPFGAILCYPVITAIDDAHKGSFEYLTGKPFDEISYEERARFSLETRVDEDSSPAFIWHTATDTTVPVISSLRMAESYYRKGIRMSLHIFPYGRHGISLATEQSSAGDPGNVVPTAESWASLAYEWMTTLE